MWSLSDRIVSQMQQLISLFPKKLTISLIAMFVVVELLTFATDRFSDSLRWQIQAAQQEQQQALAMVKQRIQAETTYVNFLHFLALRTLYADRHSILDDVNWVTQTLPRAIRLNAFSYDASTKQLSLSGRVTSLPIFFRIARYYEERKDLTEVKRTQELGERDGDVTVGIEAKRTR